MGIFDDGFERFEKGSFRTEQREVSNVTTDASGNATIQVEDLVSVEEVVSVKVRAPGTSDEFVEILEANGGSGTDPFAAVGATTDDSDDNDVQITLYAGDGTVYQSDPAADVQVTAAGY